jgi:hypothetical protein
VHQEQDARQHQADLRRLLERVAAVAIQAQPSSVGACTAVKLPLLRLPVFGSTRSKPISSASPQIFDFPAHREPGSYSLITQRKGAVTPS